MSTRRWAKLSNLFGWAWIVCVVLELVTRHLSRGDLGDVVDLDAARHKDDPAHQEEIA